MLLASRFSTEPEESDTEGQINILRDMSLQRKQIREKLLIGAGYTKTSGLRVLSVGSHRMIRCNIRTARISGNKMEFTWLILNGFTNGLSGIVRGLEGEMVLGSQGTGWPMAQSCEYELSRVG